MPSNANIATNVSVGVAVVVDNQGDLVSASVSSSSGSQIVDQAALSLVRQSKFLPGNQGCGNTVPDSAVFFVSFSPFSPKPGQLRK